MSKKNGHLTNSKAWELIILKHSKGLAWEHWIPYGQSHKPHHTQRYPRIPRGEFLQFQNVNETKGPTHFHGKKAQKSILAVEAMAKVRYCKTGADLLLRLLLRSARVFMLPSLTQHRSRQSINRGPENHTAQPSTAVPKPQSKS